jgi:hypothetical protein|tara:strand:- start:60 stop:968 length:909 start_codon:yes stop_codon:yes gene_type:complete
MKAVPDQVGLGVAKKSDDIGMKRGRVLAQLPPAQQLDVIAEGLPILLKSADDLLLAAEQLTGHPRAASILEGHATEELAKILILVDIVRCPANVRAGLIGTMFRWFYDHLARLIYADAQSWKPMNIDQLQTYVDSNRRSHTLEGYAGEYILPNWTLFSREAHLYADIVTHEDGVPMWNEPLSSPALFPGRRPGIWAIAKALTDMGALTRPGLDIVAEVWGGVDFVGSADHYGTARRLTREMLEKLDAAGLITDAAIEGQIGILSNDWQLPMYRINFKRIEVSLDDLRREQDAAMWAEFGDQG